MQNHVSISRALFSITVLVSVGSLCHAAKDKKSEKSFGSSFRSHLPTFAMPKLPKVALPKLPVISAPQFIQEDRFGTWAGLAVATAGGAAYLQSGRSEAAIVGAAGLGLAAYNNRQEIQERCQSTWNYLRADDKTRAALRAQQFLTFLAAHPALLQNALEASADFKALQAKIDGNLRTGTPGLLADVAGNGLAITHLQQEIYGAGDDDGLTRTAANHTQTLRDLSARVGTPAVYWHDVITEQSTGLHLRDDQISGSVKDQQKEIVRLNQQLETLKNKVATLEIEDLSLFGAAASAPATSSSSSAGK